MSVYAVPLEAIGAAGESDGGGARIVLIGPGAIEVRIDGSGLGQDELTAAVMSGVELGLERAVAEIRRAECRAGL